MAARASAHQRSPFDAKAPHDSISSYRAALQPKQRLWRARLLEHYARDARQAMKSVRVGSIEPALLERIIELLRTYTEVPGVAERPQVADLPMLQLAHLVAGYIVDLGYWQQMNALWPKLSEVAEFTPDVDLHIQIVKYWAIVQGRQQGAHGLAFYEQLIQHPRFIAASSELQADTLCHYATVLLWSGQRQKAAPLLARCVAVTEQDAPTPSSDATEAPLLDRRGTEVPAYLWELRAYALNQSGVMHMFCGRFKLAHRYFDDVLQIFVTHGQEENLACVAHQSTGRLLLYEGHYRAALATLQKGLVIRRRRQEDEGVAVNSIYVAAAHIALNELTAAEPLLSSALTRCRSVDNLHDWALCHLYLGELALLRNQDELLQEHWLALCHIATQTVLHFVEVRLLLRRLPRLLCRGHFALAGRLAKLVWQAVRHDQLAPLALCRFLWQ